MITQRDLMQGLYGAYRLASLDKTGLAYLDTTGAGALRSFWVLLFVVPAYLLRVLLSAGEAGITLPHLALQGLSFAVSWLAYLLVCRELARLIEREGYFPAFVTAYNWAGLLQTGVYLPVFAIAHSDMLPTEVGEFLIFAVWVLTTVYQWFVTRTALSVPGLTAVGFVLMDLIVPMFVDYFGTALHQFG